MIRENLGKSVLSLVPCSAHQETKLRIVPRWVMAHLESIMCCECLTRFRMPNESKEDANTDMLGTKEKTNLEFGATIDVRP